LNPPKQAKYTRKKQNTLWEMKRASQRKAPCVAKGQRKGVKKGGKSKIAKVNGVGIKNKGGRRRLLKNEKKRHQGKAAIGGPKKNTPRRNSPRPTGGT